MTCGIYCITNKLNGKKYIGQSVNIENRFKQHISGHDTNSHIDNSMRKHGLDNFNLEILLECDESQLDAEEIKFINLYATYMNGYNLTRGGDLKGYGNPMKNPILAKKNGEARKGYRHSEDTKERLSTMTNSTGYFRVSKEKSKKVKRGFYYGYIYPIEYGANSKKRKITATDIRTLEERVKSKGLEWFIVDDVLAKQTLKESDEFIKQQVNNHSTGVHHVIKHTDKTVLQGYRWEYRYHCNGKLKSFGSLNPATLKEKVLGAGLDWIIVNRDKALENGLL